MSCEEKNAIIEGKTGRVERSSIGVNNYEFVEERTEDGFLARDSKHFAPKAVEVDSLPDAIRANAAKGENGETLGILLGGGVVMERTIVYHGQGPSSTRSMGNETYIDAPNRITTEVYVPLSDIKGLENALQMKEISADDFEKKVETAHFRQSR
jgi:hypothetical protein